MTQKEIQTGDIVFESIINLLSISENMQSELGKSNLFGKSGKKYLQEYSIWEFYVNELKVPRRSGKDYAIKKIIDFDIFDVCVVFNNHRQRDRFLDDAKVNIKNASKNNTFITSVEFLKNSICENKNLFIFNDISYKELIDSPSNNRTNIFLEILKITEHDFVFFLFLK